MMSVQVSIPEASASTYPIWIGANLLSDLGLWMPANKSRVVIITDYWVRDRYGLTLEEGLKKAGHRTLLLSFPPGEQSKNSQTKIELEERMLEASCDRNTLVIALGGGVVGDLAGFVAATYMRGIDFIQIPTTLLAMVDSSVGGKTAVNTPQGKNLIGAFWQPKAVVSDVLCLQTLPRKDFIHGLVEAIKIFLTSDVKSLNYLDENLNRVLDLDEDILVPLIHQAVQHKATVVEKDEKEASLRVILNLGHTIGHALENLADYRILHGHAVALGILVEAKIAELMGFLQREHYSFIKSLLERLNIFAYDLAAYDVDEIIQRTQSDKKTQAGLVHYVLLKGLGQVHSIHNQFAHPISDEIVRKAYLATLEHED